MKRIALAVLSAAMLAACGRSEPAPTVKQKFDALPPAQQIYVLEHEAWPQGNETDVARASYLLRTVALKTGMSQAQVVAKTSTAVDLLHQKYGRDISPMFLLEGAAKADDVKSEESLGLYFVVAVVYLGQ